MLEAMIQKGDYVHLSNNDEYSTYFNHLSRIFALLARWYQKLVIGGDKEAEIVGDFLQKTLSTVRLLRLKYAYNQEHPMFLDLNDSGLPHWTSISELEADLSLKSERLKHLPGRRIIQEMMLEEMLRHGKDPKHLLPKMAEVQFYEELDEEKLIFNFTPGKLTIVENGSDKKVLSCIFPWLCYDKVWNKPYIYIMAFDFPGSKEELYLEYKEGEFLKTIMCLGNREVPLAILASDIDTVLPKVFPKILKRIELGPIVSPKFSIAGDHEDLVGWLNEFGQPDDFALLLESGVIFSRGEFKEKQGWFSWSPKKVRQIFAISEDALAQENQASQVHQVIMLPHQVMQQVSKIPEFSEQFSRHGKVAYDPQGGLYVV